MKWEGLSLEGTRTDWHTGPSVAAEVISRHALYIVGDERVALALDLVISLMSVVLGVRFNTTQAIYLLDSDSDFSPPWTHATAHIVIRMSADELTSPSVFFFVPRSGQCYLVLVSL